MATIILQTVDRMLAQRVEGAADGRATVVVAPHLDPPPAEGPAVILIDDRSIPGDRSAATVIGAAAQAASGRPVALMTDVMEADPILQALRAGAADILPRDAGDAELADSLSRLLNAAAMEQDRGGRLTLVMGADPESAALAATDMALVRARGGSPTLLLDCTMPTSAAQAYLDLRVDYGVASAIADIGRLDASLLSSTLARHEQSGLMLLTFDGGAGVEPAGVAPADIVALVRLLRTCCADIILCAGSLRHGGLLHDLAGLADQIDLICAQSIRELGAARRLLDRVGPDDAARARLLLWDHQSAILLDARRMTDVLGLRDSLSIPIDAVRLRNALNAGQPLAMDDDANPYLRAIRKACGLQRPARATPLLSLDCFRRVLRRPAEQAA